MPPAVTRVVRTNVGPEMTMPTRRNRLAYSLALGIVIVAGLLSRSSLAVHFPMFLSAYAGDTLWALALFLTICILFPGMQRVVVALLTIVLSFSVEFSQIYQADWINAIRSTPIGALFLGVGFKWSDLPCYTVGCLMGVTGEVMASLSKINRKPRDLFVT